MNRLYTNTQKPFQEIVFAALAINKRGSHVVLLYRLRTGDQLMMLHLGWDHQLRLEPLARHRPDSYLWRDLSIEPERAKQLAHVCQSIYESFPEGIPYAFGSPFGAFTQKEKKDIDENDKFVLADQCVGLTCASFVASVLETAGINLLDRREWGRHSDDQKFFAYTIRALKGEFDDIPKAERPDHYLAVEQQVANGAVRYKPTEVAGAATAGFMPISFFEAVMLAGEISCELPDAHIAPPWV